jgi:hypothetical protein
MRSILPRGRFLLVGLGLPLGCGGAESHLFAEERAAADNFLQDEAASKPPTLKAGPAALTFPGGGTSGAAQPLSPSLGPESSTACDPGPRTTAADEPPVQHVCFFAADDPSALAATIEQVVEIVGTEQWVHLRLTLSPDFVDNTYGEAAIGWETAGVKPAKAEPPKAEPPPAHPERATGPGAANPPTAAGPGAGGHTFRDLVGSDHAEIQLLDAEGQIALEFRLDYLSASDAAPSGYASLGVNGGEGRVSIGDPAWILASSTSMDRNLNACALGSFVTDSPETDPSYTPDPSASDWDYRVSYEAWIADEAFADVGFGSALIELVHASPSKQGGNSLNVLPAPCPADPDNPTAAPEPLPPVLATIR